MLGLSGGPDSMFLAHELHREAQFRAATLRLVHVNYGLRGRDADRDEQLVRDWAERQRLPLRVSRPTREVLQGNLQAAARRIRRNLLLEEAGEKGLVFLAHHAEDQHENLLAGLLKGKKPWGIPLMRARSGNWLRPMLHMKRQDILAACTAQGIPYRQDLSNQDPRASERNWIRHKLLVPFRARDGRDGELLDSIGRRLLNLQDRLQEKVCELVDRLHLQVYGAVRLLERKAALPYHDLLLEQAIRHLAREWGVWSRDPGQGHLARLVAAWRQGRPGSRIPLGSDWEFGVGRDLVSFAPARPVPCRRLLTVEAARALYGCETGVPGPLLLRNWEAGDRIPPGLVADLMGQRGDPPACKVRQPVICTLNGTVVAVPGLWPGPAGVGVGR